MADANSKKESLFTPVSEASAIVKLVETVARHKVPLTIWFKEQALRFETHVSEYLPNLKKLTFALPTSVGAEALSAALKQQGSMEMLVSFQVDTVQYFGKVTVLNVLPPESIRVEVPKEIFKLQRRANLRIPFKRHEAPKVSCTHPEAEGKAALADSDILHFRMLDISAGGMSVAAPLALKDILAVGKILKDLRFHLKGTDITCTAVVRHHKDTENDQGQPMVRIGLQFSALRPQFERWIASFVMDESRRMFSIMY